MNGVRSQLSTTGALLGTPGSPAGVPRRCPPVQRALNATLQTVYTLNGVESDDDDDDDDV